MRVSVVWVTYVGRMLQLDQGKYIAACYRPDAGVCDLGGSWSADVGSNPAGPVKIQLQVAAHRLQQKLVPARSHPDVHSLCHTALALEAI